MCCHLERFSLPRNREILDNNFSIGASVPGRLISEINKNVTRVHLYVMIVGFKLVGAVLLEAADLSLVAVLDRHMSLVFEILYESELVPWISGVM